MGAAWGQQGCAPPSMVSQNSHHPCVRCSEKPQGNTQSWLSCYSAGSCLHQHLPHGVWLGGSSSPTGLRRAPSPRRQDTAIGTSGDEVIITVLLKSSNHHVQFFTMSLFRGSAVLLGLGRDFFHGVFLVIFLKNSTIKVGFGTHLQKTAQSTNIEGKGQFIPERGARGQGEHKGETKR